MKQLLIVLLFLLVSSSCRAEEPWGKDSSLTTPRSVRANIPAKTGIAQGLIRFHQVIISPADGPRSHFYPSSSQYALDAINKHGFLTGYTLGCDRLLRENEQEWIYPHVQIGRAYLKYDPVP